MIGGLIAARQQILIRSGTRYLCITIKGLAKVYVRQIAVIIGIGVLLATLLGGLTFLVVSKALPIYHELNKTQEFLTSDLFTKGFLGFLFGGVLAIWLARIYHVKPDAKLTVAQKLPEAGKRWVVVAPPGSTESRLLLAKAVGDEQVSRIGNQTGGRVFLFLFTDDFWRDYEAYKAKGVEFVRGEPRDESYGRVAVFLDLYGNMWDLIEPHNQ